MSTPAHEVVDQAYAYSAAMGDLLEAVSTDLLPPPINVGWYPERADQLTVQIKGSDQRPWLAAMEALTLTLCRSTTMMMQAEGYLRGKRTRLTLLYDRLDEQVLAVEATR